MQLDQDKLVTLCFLLPGHTGMVVYRCSLGSSCAQSSLYRTHQWASRGCVHYGRCKGWRLRDRIGAQGIGQALHRPCAFRFRQDALLIGVRIAPPSARDYWARYGFHLMVRISVDNFLLDGMQAIPPTSLITTVTNSIGTDPALIHTTLACPAHCPEFQGTLYSYSSTR